MHQISPQKIHHGAISVSSPPISLIHIKLEAYMFKKTAPAPKRAAAPTAPVFIGMAPPEEEEDEPDVVVAAAPPLPRVPVADGTPLVNGTFEALDAPEKATAPAVAEAPGAVVFDGLRTWSMTCTKR